MFIDCLPHGSAPSFDAAETALLQLVVRLKKARYDFVAPTPATHARILSRAGRRYARTLRDIFGWSLPFDRKLLDPDILAALQAADMLEVEGELLRSRVRISVLHGDYYLHSAYPTDAEDSVFFGPDSYRFAALVDQEFTRASPRRGAHIVDIGTGTGVGAIVAARMCSDARITMTDINPTALRFATLNAAAAGVEAATILSADLEGIQDPVDIALANPPYIIDAAGRDYRDGGSMHGGAVAVEMARIAAERLAPGGRFILYTGSAIIDGEDPLKTALTEISEKAECTMRYRELDPDVFGEELEHPAYADVERIAVVAALLQRPAKGR